MTTIKATCPMCGDVQLTPFEVTVTISDRTDLTCYAFECPTGHDEVRKPADDDVVALLLSGGVRSVRHEIPAEALEVHGGAQLGPDDLLDFALGLGVTDDLVAQLECEGLLPPLLP